MKEYACHYAVARFRPYPDGGEFVNVGVLLCCPQTGAFDFVLETARRRARVTHFFSELDAKTYRDGLNAWREELTRLHYAATPATARALFEGATQPRATAWQTGSAGLVLTDNPHRALQELFARYVLRQYEATREAPELRLRRRVAGLLRGQQLLRFYPERRIGGEDYGATLPFVYWPPESEKPLKAIKPLYLNRNTPNEVYDYADDWIARIKRLRRRNAWPAQTLFATQAPAVGARSHAAYAEVAAELRALEVEVEPLAANSALLQFAREGLETEPVLAGIVVN